MAALCEGAGRLAKAVCSRRAAGSLKPSGERYGPHDGRHRHTSLRSQPLSAYEQSCAPNDFRTSRTHPITLTDTTTANYQPFARPIAHLRQLLHISLVVPQELGVLVI